MTLNVEVLICLLGAVSFFIGGIQLLRFRLPSNAQSSVVHMSVEQRRSRVRKISFLCFGMSAVMLVGAIVLSRIG